MPFCSANWKILLPVWRGLTRRGRGKLGAASALLNGAAKPARRAPASPATRLTRPAPAEKGEPRTSQTSRRYRLSWGARLPALVDFGVGIHRLAIVGRAAAAQQRSVKLSVGVLAWRRRWSARSARGCRDRRSAPRHWPAASSRPGCSCRACWPRRSPDRRCANSGGLRRCLVGTSVIGRRRAGRGRTQIEIRRDDQRRLGDDREFVRRLLGQAGGLAHATRSRSATRPRAQQRKTQERIVSNLIITSS